MPQYGPEQSYEAQAHRRQDETYSRKTMKRQEYLEDLQDQRRKDDKQRWKEIVALQGPTWYQALSVTQRCALDTLGTSIHHDLIEGRPTYIRPVIRELGIYPIPGSIDLMISAHHGRDNPQVMIAHLFEHTFGHAISVKRTSYSLNARLMLSAILYLGMDHLISLLREKFRPDPQEPVRKTRQKQKKSPRPLSSPYLEKITAVMWIKRKVKPSKPPPLPAIDDSEELEGGASEQPSRNSMSTAKDKEELGKKSKVKKEKSGKKNKLFVPSTGLDNAQYTIAGVTVVKGQKYYILNTVTILQTDTEMIHGGFAIIEGLYLNIHCGYRSRPPPPLPDPCDCMKAWNDTIFDHVKTYKCRCGHRYDFHNQGPFPRDELLFFHKPTLHSPYYFDCEAIYELDPQRLHIAKEFKNIWDTDSMLKLSEAAQNLKKKKRKGPTVGLGPNPSPQDYILWALARMRDINLIATLPDAHLVPELVEWMRKRIYGPLSKVGKLALLKASERYWPLFTVQESSCHGHVLPKIPPELYERTNFNQKARLKNIYEECANNYIAQTFRAQARIANTLWPTMYQAQVPNKSFRETYFTYIPAAVHYMHIIQP
ncbi:hypothetical protein EVAR_22910_1 [Eumeta japonica]|uniref:DUF4771 domain-containing protein n=1 Tax=Eumeta variegata TaxID=151549 RepID=A0A4C1UUN5_EUMVA|nr:hypothetical protein EVAR_22910_1 [Eumeta japonica]